MRRSLCRSALVLVLCAVAPAPGRAQDGAAPADGGQTASAPDTPETPPPGTQAPDTQAPDTQAPDTPASDARPGSAQGSAPSSLQPLAHSIAPWWAIAIGALGSLGYLLAAYAGFIGNDDAARSRILAHFDGRASVAVAKVLAFAAVGGGVAMVFQLTEHYLVPIQGFILGCTWPAVVANYLSARQRGSEAGVEAQVAAAMREEAALREQVGVLETLPPPPDAAAARDAIDALLRTQPEKTPEKPDEPPDERTEE